MPDDLFFIRGQRIIQQLDERSTVPDLEDNIVRGFPETKKRQHVVNQVTSNNIQYTPYIGMNTLHVKSTSSSNGHNYQQALQFNGVKFESADTPDNSTFAAADGTDYHIQPLDLSNHNCKVRCNCLDFHFRFSTFNSGDQSLVGRPPPLYQRKTNRPPVNPTQVPGMCKHLLSLVQALQSAGVIKQH